MTPQQLLDQLDIMRLRIEQLIETKPDGAVSAYISDNDGNIFDVTVDKIAIEVVDDEITIAILSHELGEFING